MRKRRCGRSQDVEGLPRAGYVSEHQGDEDSKSSSLRNGRISFIASLYIIYRRGSLPRNKAGLDTGGVSCHWVGGGPCTLRMTRGRSGERNVCEMEETEPKQEDRQIPTRRERGVGAKNPPSTPPSTPPFHPPLRR